jgi:hypothetical protein
MVSSTTTSARSEVLPDIPTVGEFLPGYEASTWFGVGVPNNTPAEILSKLNQEINAALANSSRGKASLGFTSDTHFGDHRALNIRPPPFGSLDEMNETLIAR